MQAASQDGPRASCTEGYIRLANYYLASGDASQYALADENMKKALDVATQKDEAHYQVAKTIYSYMISLEEGQEAYKEWSYEKALELIKKAVQSSAQPIHIQLEGDILFAQGNYADAFEAYNKVNQTSFASAATFYSASKAKQLTEGSNMNEVLALMDSAIVKLSKPYFGEAAPYFYERAELRAQAGKFREAVMDYNTFYSGDVAPHVHGVLDGPAADILDGHRVSLRDGQVLFPIYLHLQYT